MSREDPDIVAREVTILASRLSSSTSSRQARKGCTETISGNIMVDFDRTIKMCDKIHKRKTSQPSDKPDLSDQGMYKLARFSDALDLHRYGRFVHLIPRIVNVVSASAQTQPALSGRARLTSGVDVVLTARRGGARARHQHRAAAQPARGRQPAYQRGAIEPGARRPAPL